ncbi:MAG: TetR/AcrR family transcriptional regulator [Chloroflexi bacterium]|nr:TetR/AcrR family transcriptional regulator [Chloroflexota bacterium]
MTEQDANKRDEILQAALRVFATQGYHRASIKSIAAEAGLKSPSLIYWYFKDKQELLYAAMEKLSPLMQQVTHPEALLELPPEQFFRLIADGYFSVFRNPNGGRVLRVFLAEAAKDSELVGIVAPKMRGVLDLLMAYIMRQIERGTLRPHDPQASARAFIGTLLVYIIGKEVIPPLGVGLPDTDTYADEIVSIFLQGLTP